MLFMTFKLFSDAIGRANSLIVNNSNVYGFDEETKTECDSGKTEKE